MAHADKYQLEDKDEAVRVLFLCDQKWRDLPGLVAIATSLERRGHRVHLAPTKGIMHVASLFRPDAVIFNHLISPENRLFAQVLKRNGRAVVVLPTEGAMRPEYTNIAAGEFSDYSDTDLYLAWSEPAAADLRSRWGWGNDRVAVTGSTRFDFHHESFRSLVTPRERFCATHGLDPDRVIVTWATAYAYASVYNNPSPAVQGQFERETRAVGVAACLERIGIPLHDMPRLFAEARDKCAESFFAAAEALPDVQFVLKPHPVENPEYYRSHIRRRGLKNIRFCPTDYIWNILCATDIHLHRQCTTAVEAWMWQKPTVEMGMDYHPAWEWPSRERGSYQVKNIDELVDVIRSSVGSALCADMLAHRHEHLTTWFGDMDGRRSLAAAERIDTLLASREPSPWAKPLHGLGVTAGRSLRSALAFFLDRAPGEPILRRQRSIEKAGLGSEDKHIRRSDVARYRRAIAMLYRNQPC